MKRILVVTLALLVGHGALAEETFEQVLSGKTIPLTLKLKDLDQNWRRFNAGGASEGGGQAAMIRAMSGMSASAEGYYTKGQTVTISGETYLVAYHAQAKALEGAAIMMAMRGGQPPEPEKPTALTTLALTLLDLRTTGSLGDIRPFNLESELSGTDAPAGDEDKPTQEANDASLKNLRQIGTAVLTYTTERKVLPVLTDAKSAREELVLYLRDKEVLNQPSTKKPYLPNPALSGHKPSEFDKPEKTVVFYEAAAATDGTRGVLFLDGHADRIAESQWKRIKEISQLP